MDSSLSLLDDLRLVESDLLLEAMLDRGHTRTKQHSILAKIVLPQLSLLSLQQLPLIKLINGMLLVLPQISTEEVPVLTGIECVVDKLVLALPVGGGAVTGRAQRRAADQVGEPESLEHANHTVSIGKKSPVAPAAVETGRAI